MLYPINIHGTDGKMIVSLAFKTLEKAEQLLTDYKQFSHVVNQDLMEITDDFGHVIVIGFKAIGFMIYVDEELDNELGEYIAKKMFKAQEKARVRDKIVKV